MNERNVESNIVNARFYITFSYLFTAQWLCLEGIPQPSKQDTTQGIHVIQQLLKIR